MTQLNTSVSPEKEARIAAIAAVLGFHTEQVLQLADQLRAGRLAPARAEEALYVRFERSVVALLACTDAAGPP